MTFFQTILASCVATGLSFPMAHAQAPLAVSGTVADHRAAAKAAAGQDFTAVYSAACPPETPRPAGRGPGPARGAGPRPDPPREEWYAEPVKVFDNLYFVGTRVHGAWAITTSDGIILIEALYGYAAEPEIAEGLKKVGLNPANIKYVIVSHGHGDHSGGAKFLQDQFHPRLILGALDWDLLERDTRNPAPKRDMVAQDGQKITLGDTTVTLYITPGHTGTTISPVIEVRDGGQRHMAIEWGGTVISASTPIPLLESYIRNAERMRDIAGGSGADILIANHTAFDGTLAKLEAVQKRKPGEPNPYIVGKAAVARYLTVAEECGKATLLAAQAQPK
jgi:metallo-beta-lactamase class B